MRINVHPSVDADDDGNFDSDVIDFGVNIIDAKIADFVVDDSVIVVDLDVFVCDFHK